MSARGLAKADTFGPGATRKHFPVGHVLVDVTSHSTYGTTFGLRTAEGPDNRPTLFSGHVTPDMPQQLRQLADFIESKIGGAT